MDPQTGLDAWARGGEAERFVEAALTAKGWEVVASNWSGGGGELDRVVLRRGKLRFVEVKVHNDEDPFVEEPISYAQQRRLRQAAEAFLAYFERVSPRSYREVCFLLAQVDVRTTPWTISWLDDPFDG